MKAIEIHPQPILSFGRTVKITVNGIRYRLFRSLVTVVVVAVAVAFLTNILSESLIRKSIARRTERRIAEIRCAAAWTGYLTNPGTVEEILQRLAQAEPTDPFCREAAAMGGLSQAETASFRAAAAAAAQYLAFLSGLDYARRRALLHTASGAQIFDHLQDKASMERFRNALKVMRSVRLPTSLQAFEEFVRQWPTVRAQALRVRAGRAKAIRLVAAKLGGRPVLEALAEADGAFGGVLRQAGFALDAAAAADVATQAKRVLDMHLLERTVADPKMRQAIAGYLDILPTDVSVRTLWDFLRERRTASWYLARQKELGGEAAGFPLARIVELGKLEAEIEALARAERMGAATDGASGAGGRMRWLVLASMLVCVVGISNSMLMSVTERFREIATLKCLGALDGFIMLMFVLEAAFLGIVGGTLGAVLGTLLGLGRMLLPYGSLVMASLPVGNLAAAIALSSVLGVVLAAIASVYPSFKAARLAPMEAMRIQ